MKNFKKLDRNKNVIPIDQFIINYLNDGVFLTCNDLTHKDLKKFSNPYVISVPFEYADACVELIYTGDIILVRDILGNIAPYINPNNLKILYQIDSVEKEISEIYKKRIEITSLLSEWQKLQKLLFDLNRIKETKELLEDLKLYKQEMREKDGKKY